MLTSRCSIRTSDNIVSFKKVAPRRDFISKFYLDPIVRQLNLQKSRTAENHQQSRTIEYYQQVRTSIRLVVEDQNHIKITRRTENQKHSRIHRRPDPHPTDPKDQHPHSFQHFDLLERQHIKTTKSDETYTFVTTTFKTLTPNFQNIVSVYNYCI